MATKKTPTKVVTVDELIGSHSASSGQAAEQNSSLKKTTASKKKEAASTESSVEPKEKTVTSSAREESEAKEDVSEKPAAESITSPVVSTIEEKVESAPDATPRKIHIGSSEESTSVSNDNRGYSRPANEGRFNNNRYQSQNYSQQRNQVETGPTEVVKGFLDSQPEGHGFLRPKFIPSTRDIYISQSQIRRFMLRPGDMVEGVARPPKDTERYYGLLKVEKVNEIPADESMKRPHFDDLTAIYPTKQVVLSTGKTPLSTRVIDLIAPIGFGQRGMIVSPPKAGKTTILKEIAAGISANFPNVHLMAALIGERPEEVTDISMSVKGEVVASNFDEPPENQTRVAEITLERAKRMVELGKDVIILLDSITRLARAYNLVVDPSGRTLSGGFDPGALYPAKKFFGAARNCQEGGSLTIIGTALVETGSRMDDLIYEEFKGTGNMELHLVRSLAEKRIYPAISIERSGTRGEEKILEEEKLKKIVTMRRMMDMLDSQERTAIIVERLGKTETNDEFLETLGKS